MDKTLVVNIDKLLVSQLIATQFPQWADLPIRSAEAVINDTATAFEAVLKVKFYTVAYFVRSEKLEISVVFEQIATSNSRLAMTWETFETTPDGRFVYSVTWLKPGATVRKTGRRRKSQN